MKAVFLSLFCAVFLLTLISVEAVDFQITDSELNYGSASTHKQETFARSLAIRNDFPECTLQNINLEFTERNGFRRSDIEINTTPTTITPTQSNTVLATIHPGDFDLVDEDLEEREEVEIGTLSLRAEKINATSTNTINCEGQVTSNAIPVTLQLKNDLDIVSIEIQPDGGSFNSISEDGTVTIFVDENYDLKFKLHNRFEASSDIELENINIEITSDDFDVDKRTTISEILADEEGEKTTSVSVDETGTGEIKVLISGDDHFGGKHGQVFLFNFDVEESEEVEDPVVENDGDGDGVPDGQDACLNTVSVCSVDGQGCPVDSDDDGTCDDLDPTPYPRQQLTNDQLDVASNQNDRELEEDTTRLEEESAPTSENTSGFIPFLIGFAVGIMVTAGFSVLIKS